MKSSYTDVDQQWLEQFVRVLRTGGLDDARTREARAHVESYCTDSGRSTEEEFGSPEDYARSLLAAVPSARRRSWLDRGVGTPLVVGVLGMLLGLQTVGSWATGTVPLTWAIVVTGAVFLAATAVATHHGAALSRQPWTGVLLLSVAFGAIVAFAVIWEATSPLQLPRGSAVLLSVTLLATSSVWLHRRRPGDDDLTDPPAAADVLARARRRRNAAIALVLPACTAVLAMIEGIKAGTAA